MNIRGEQLHQIMTDAANHKTRAELLAENERLRNTLKMQRAWLQHWRDDLRYSTLRPTLDSLADAEEAILSALSRTRSLEDAA